MKQSNQEKGRTFEEFVCQGFNLLLNLTGRNRVKPMYRSGAFKGMKGDLINLPKWLPFTVECKDWGKLDIEKWWDQVCDEANEMGTSPWLIFKLGKGELSVRLLADDLRLLKRLKDGQKETR